jgi:hypothetical protein
LIKTLTIAKSAIRHNMAKDLPKMRANLYYMGKNDKVTPPDVAEEFNNYCRTPLYIGSTNAVMRR